MEFSHPAWKINVTITGKREKIDVSPPELEQVWDRIETAAWDELYDLFGMADLPHIYLLRELAVRLVDACFSEAPSRTKYLPAARSGLMQSHKVLAGLLVRRASLAGIEDISIPRMNGILTDFLGELIEVDRNTPSAFEDVSRLLETEILHGEVVLTEELSGYPEVIFSSDAGDFRLNRTSSMISELVPIVIYLRYIVREGDLLFIEEPEAQSAPRKPDCFRPPACTACQRWPARLPHNT